MRLFFLPADAPIWLRLVVYSIRDGLSDVWNTALRLKNYTTAGLPPAADWTQGLVYDSTLNAPHYSNGTSWVRLSDYDADVAAIAALSTTGLIVRTGAGTAATRSIVAPAAGITVTNGDGVAGNPTLALANDLGALEALTGTSTIYYRSAADTWSPVTIGGLLSFSAGTLDVGDAELTAIAGLVSAADRLPYFTGAGTAALATFTAAGRALIDDADAAAQRTTLGLGTAAVKNTGASGDAVPLLNVANTWSAQQTLTAGLYENGSFMARIENTGTNAPTGSTGIGLELIGSALATYGLVRSYNRTTSAYAPLKLDGSAITFQIAGTDEVTISATALNIASGSTYQVNGTSVVGAQGAAVADASGGATVDAEARTAINTLLARLRTHGLIAT